MQGKANNNGELAMDQRRDVNKAALLNDVEQAFNDNQFKRRA